MTATAWNAAESSWCGTASPRTVTPIVTPTGRAVCSTPEAIPLRSVGTCASASCVSGVTASPVPIPATAIPRATSSSPAPSSTPRSNSIPQAIRPTPTVGTGAPGMRASRRPANGEMIMKGKIVGRYTTPVSIAP